MVINILMNFLPIVFLTIGCIQCYQYKGRALKYDFFFESNNYTQFLDESKNNISSNWTSSGVDNPHDDHKCIADIHQIQQNVQKNHLQSIKSILSKSEKIFPAKLK